jgi:hypothetical protein
MQGLDRFGNRWQQNGSNNTFLATFTGNNLRQYFAGLSPRSCAG